MSDMKMPSRDEVIELLKSARDEAAAEAPITDADLKKALQDGLREAIDLHKAELVKMRDLEVSALKKTAMKSVFSILRKGEDYIDMDHSNDPKKRLNGGETQAGSKVPTGPSPELKSPDSVKAKTVFDYLKKEELEKGFAGPKLGGKDPQSKVMTNDAISASSKAAAPAASSALPKPKMPSMEEHAARSNSYADFMPQGKKFGKAEWDSEKCPYCREPLSKCSCK